MIKMLNGKIVTGFVAWEDFKGEADYFKVKADGTTNDDRLIVCKFARGGWTNPTPQGLSVQVDPMNPVDIPAKGDRVVLTQASEDPNAREYYLAAVWFYWDDFNRDSWARDASVVYTASKDGQVVITDTLYNIVYRFPKNGLMPDDLAGADWQKTVSGKMYHCPDPRPDHDAFAYARRDYTPLVTPSLVAT